MQIQVLFKPGPYKKIFAGSVHHSLEQSSSQCKQRSHVQALQTVALSIMRLVFHNNGNIHKH